MSEVRERKNKKQDHRRNQKQKDTWIPGFVSEEIALKILSEVFKVCILHILG